MPGKACHLFIQDEIRRDLDPQCAADALGLEITRFDAGLARNPDLLARRLADGAAPLVFCSLQLAGRLLQTRSPLARGIFLPRRFLEHHVYTSLLEPSDLLNPDGIYLPWKDVPRRLEMLTSLFGQTLFLRPSSPAKPFPGFAVDAGEIVEEHRLREATDRVSPEELVFVAPARPLPEIEYRVWIVDARPVAAAAYSWSEIAPDLPVPGSVLDAAARMAARLELREQVFTADLVDLEDGARLVELNAVSTSGWYPGLDIAALLAALRAILA